MSAEQAPGDIARIENVPLRVSVADIIRQAIINGTMRPGTPVVEMALAEQLNVSRAPVREAIQILEADGLIESEPYKGKRVKPLSVKEVEELYSLREQFEAFAIRRIVESKADVSELTTHSDAMFAAAENGDLAALNVADEAFHRTLIRLTNQGISAKSQLQQTFASLRAELFGKMPTEEFGQTVSMLAGIEQRLKSRLRRLR